VLYALSACGEYISQAFKDRIDASFRKACRWKLTRKQYTFMDLLSEVDSKLIAKCKSEGHCLHHMLPPSHPSSHIMDLRPRGHDVPRVTYGATKRSFTMRCL